MRIQDPMERGTREKVYNSGILTQEVDDLREGRNE